MRQGRQTLVGTPPLQNLHLRAKVEKRRRKNIQTVIIWVCSISGASAVYFFFFDSTVPPVEPVSERHLSLRHTSPNHHSPRLVGIPSTKRLHSKQKLGLEKLCKIVLLLGLPPFNFHDETV